MSIVVFLLLQIFILFNLNQWIFNRCTRIYVFSTSFFFGFFVFLMLHVFCFAISLHRCHQPEKRVLSDSMHSWNSIWPFCILNLYATKKNSNNNSYNYLLHYVFFENCSLFLREKKIIPFRSSAVLIHANKNRTLPSISFAFIFSLERKFDNYSVDLLF